MKSEKTAFIYAFLFCFIIALDRVTKYWAQQMSYDHVCTSWLTWSLHYNRGISWGMFHSESAAVYTIVSLIIILFAFIFTVHTFLSYREGKDVLGELMVCAGAFSNIIDRVMYKGVVDFIVCSIGSWSWPVFNIADMFIVIGLMYMMYSGLLYAKRTV